VANYQDIEISEIDFISEPDRYKLDDFQVYQNAREFRKRVYVNVNQLPEKEKYQLTSQMRDAIISITNNIAEAHGRWHYKESIQFCRIARGSTEEVIDDLNICIDEHYYDVDECTHLKKSGYELVKKINGYIAYLNKQRNQYKKT